MAIYIKGMKMPTDKNVAFVMTPKGDVFMVGNTLEEHGHLAKTQAIFVPPHGKLIDASKCEGFFYEHMSDKMMEIAMIAIEEMPTIIPAEEDEL